MKTSISEMAVMAEDASISREAPTSDKKWKKPMIFGGAILLLVWITVIWIPMMVSMLEWTSVKSSVDSRIAENQVEIEKIETKLDDTVKEEKERISSRLDLVIRGDGEY